MDRYCPRGGSADPQCCEAVVAGRRPAQAGLFEGAGGTVRVIRVLRDGAQQIGGSFGTAVLAVILEGAIATHPATLADAFHVAFWWSAGFSAVAVLLSLWLPGAQRAPEASRDNAPRQRTDPVRA